MKRLRLLLMATFLNAAVADDAFRVLRDEAGGFAKVVPGKRFVFPRDHAAHPDYRIEWWYLTANLTDQRGRDWGLQWTLFRQALSAEPVEGGWSNNQLWMAHAAISSPDGHQFEQRFARGGIGQAGVNKLNEDESFEAWIDDWVWRTSTNSLFPARLSFSVNNTQINLLLTSSENWVLNGDGGYSQKSSQGQASYYYSQPEITIDANISGADFSEQLNGVGWLDREWSSQPLAENQQGWDWFSLHLDDGNKLMVYRLRHGDDNHWLSGSWIDKKGQIKALSKNDIQITVEELRAVDTGEQNKVKLPLVWQIELPGLNRVWRVEALYDQQWMGARFPYWEGVVLVENDDGQRVGKGYMELTGYQ